MVFDRPFLFFGRNSIVIFGVHLAMFPFAQIPVVKVLHIVPNSWAAVLCFEFPLIIVVSYFLTLLLVKYFPMCIGKKRTLANGMSVLLNRLPINWI